MGYKHTTQSPGLFVLSLDTEIAWGTFDNGGQQRFRTHFDQYRDLVRRLVELLDAYHIPATWAFVGHLLLEHCERSAAGTTHPEVLRPQYSWYPHDWHHHDPATDIHRDPWWYGTDVLAMVRSARTPHEIGTHTFSHIVVDDPACTADIFRSQLAACAELHSRHGLTLQSIVFPRNQIAYADVLPEYGITTYRGQERRWYSRRWPRTAGSGIWHILDRFFPFPPSTYPREELSDGTVVNLPASMMLLPRDGFRRYIPLSTRIQQACAGLRRAAKRGELFHLWFHPFNLGSDARLFNVLRQIFRTASDLRASGQLEICTMQQTAALVH